MRRSLYFTVFSAGMTSLAVEMMASYVMGPYFGDSRLVWAAIIGLILIYLTVGAYFGGRWADKNPSTEMLYTILAWAAFTSGAVPLLATPILRPVAEAFDTFQFGILISAFGAVLILFSVPVSLLGTISPFVIRLMTQNAEESGSVAGRIYAISTLGAFLGTFLPVLVLIPWIGTRASFLTFSGFLLGVAFWGLWRSRNLKKLLYLLWMPIVLICLAFFWLRSPYKTTSGQIYEGESSYNYIQVIERQKYRYLRLNEGQGIHSTYHPTEVFYGGPWEQFLVAPFFNTSPFLPRMVKRIAIVGLAAGRTGRQATIVFGAIPIDGYELDEKIIEVGKRYFDMNQPNLNAIAQDGRWGLSHSPYRYTMIAIDAYRPPYIPWHLTTREFFEVVQQHLTSDGVVAINVGRAPQDRRLVDALATTMGTVFPSVFVMDVPDTFNTVVYATAQPNEWINLYQNYSFLAEQNSNPLLLEAIKRALTNIQPTPQNGIVFEDDRAPVEWITHSLIFNFMLSGGVEELRE